MTISTMEPPALWDAEMIRDHKVEVLKAVRAVDPDVDAVRGQYTAGLVEGDTGARLPRRARRRPDVAHRHVRGGALRTSTRGGGKACPVLMRSGKRLAAKAHEVAFRFREPPTRLFRHTPLEHAEPNWLVFRDEPDRAHRSRRAHEAARPRARSARVGARARRTRDEHDRQRSVRVRRSAARRDRRRPHAVPALRRGRVVVAHRRPGAQGVGRRGAPEDYVAGSDGPTGQHRFLGPGHAWRPLAPRAISDRYGAAGGVYSTHLAANGLDNATRFGSECGRNNELLSGNVSMVAGEPIERLHRTGGRNRTEGRQSVVRLIHNEIATDARDLDLADWSVTGDEADRAEVPEHARERPCSRTGRRGPGRRSRSGTRRRGPNRRYRSPR